MGKVTKAKEHLTTLEIERKIKETTGFSKVQKWLIIYNALNYPRKAEEIANHLAVSKSLVNKTVSEYNRNGALAIETTGKGGRKHSYLTPDDEIKFMNRFKQKKADGYAVTTTEIKIDFEKLVGKKVHKTTIFRLLNRHFFKI